MRLREIFLRGFKSIDGVVGQTIPLGDITVLLGANGSGKSNLVAFFKMLNFMATGALQQYVARQGGRNLLFYGPKKTESIFFELHFESEEVLVVYSVQLSYGLPDRLFVSGEKVTYHKKNLGQTQEYYLASGAPELAVNQDEHAASRMLYALLSGIRTYQFHDTSDTAKIKDRSYVDDARYLRSDGGNLAAFLRMLKTHETYVRYYERIVQRIRRVMPQFGDFELDSIPGNEDYVRLNWRDSSGDDYLFGPDQISDGSLRFMALATLLLQPPELLPRLIVLDEPELGLHPAAITELAGIVRSASRKTQVLIATQSMRLVDEFCLEDLVVVERDGERNGSLFRKLEADRLNDWLERYSLSELWEKNVLGGQP